MLHVLIAIVVIVGAGCSDDLRKRKVSEPTLILGRLTTAVKVHAAEFAALPIGTSKQLPTSGSTDATYAKGCCGGKSDGKTPDNKCPVSTEFTSDPIWTKLGVALTEPLHYRYKYESTDGKSFVITAEGDLDCDNQPATFTLSGSLDASGKVTTTITPPVSGEY